MNEDDSTDVEGDRLDRTFFLKKNFTWKKEI